MPLPQSALSGCLISLSSGRNVLLLRTFGGLWVENEDASRRGGVRPRRVALLALLAAAGAKGRSREQVLAILWPDSPSDRARAALSQTLYSLHSDLDAEVVLATTAELHLDRARLTSDLEQFKKAQSDKDWARAAALYTGPFLDGFYLNDAPEFERWVDEERGPLARDGAGAIERAARAAEESGRLGEAGEYWQRLTRLEPLHSASAVAYMTALVQLGDRAGALAHGKAHAQLVRQELETDPDRAVAVLLAALRERGSMLPAAADIDLRAPQTVPEAYQELVQQELEMEPDSAIADLAAALSRPAITATTASDALGIVPKHPSVTPSVAAATPKGKQRSRRETTVLYAVIALAILISATAIWGWMRPRPAKQVVRYTMAIDSTEAMAPATPWSGRVAISPDGARLAYIGGPRSRLLIRARNQLHAIAVPGTEGANTPFFSPDGRRVGFLRERSVQIASLSGGPPITVTDLLTGTAGASWGPDNSIYVDASDDNTGLLRVEATRGSKPSLFTVLDTAKGEFDHTWPDVLPNGKGVLFTVLFSGRTGVKGTISHAVAVAEIPSGKYRVIVDDALYARYASSGHLLYVTTNKRLMVVPFDQNSMKIAGEPTAVSEGIRLALLGGSADLAVSATGTLVYATGAGEGKQELVWVARDGKAQAVDPAWPGNYLGPALSPDGNWLAVARVPNVEPIIHIWVKRLDRGPSIKLTLEGNADYWPAWTPDGRSVTYSSTSATGAVDLWTKRADGGTQAVMQLHEKGNLYNPRWSPDGKWLIFQTDIGSPGSGDILGIRPGIDSAPVPIVATNFSEMSPAFSPNARWLAYVSNETGADEIYVVPFPNTGSGKWAISAGGGTEPLWSHRGSELFYRDASGDLVAVEVHTNPTFSLGRSVALFPAAGYTYLRFSPQYAVARDDQRFLMIRPLETGTPDKLSVVENWFEELGAKSRK